MKILFFKIFNHYGAVIFTLFFKGPILGIYIYISLYLCISLCIYTNMYIFIYKNKYIYVYIYICIYIQDIYSDTIYIHNNSNIVNFY
jgi:hypothetical protein